MWNIFFDVTLHFFTGRSSRLDKAKLQFYSVMAGLYYGMKVDYASVLCDEITTNTKNSNKSTEISRPIFWRLILHDSYSQAQIMIPKRVKVAQFTHLQIPKDAIDDTVIFPFVGRTLHDMLRLVSDSNQLLIQYKISLHLTSSAPTPKKATFNVKEGTTEDPHIFKKKAPYKFQNFK